ncbi:uncharacterized protein [Nothobranchius furzeri]|uniref:uncharacterized protein n=1 Tax=Nothobranchius furzeri TaxID=105023 RepID=UPI0039047D10
MWILFGYSGFLPQSKNMPVRRNLTVFYVPRWRRPFRIRDVRGLGGPQVPKSVDELQYDQTLLSFRSFTIAQDAPRTYHRVCLPEQRTGPEANDDHELRTSRYVCPVPGKRRRKRGIRAGIQVRVKLLLKRGLSSKHRRDLLASCPLFGDLSATSAFPPGRVVARFIRPSFLRSVYPHSSVVSPPVPSISGFYKHRGSNPSNLRPLTPAVSVVSDSSTSLCMALLNSCSVNNKSFLLNDLILSKNLDFLFLTEVWQQTSDYSGLIELCPSGHSFLSQPRGSGCGGGLAVVFRDHLPCSSTTSGHFASFELQLIKGTVRKMTPAG